MIIIILLAIVAAIVLFAVSIYNKLVTLRNRVRNAWAQIDVQLKLRADLIPNLVETVKGYAKHESGTLENVIKARNMVNSATTHGESIEANNMLTGALKTLFAVAEAYPDLKANSNFMDLQEKLTDIEKKIGFARQSYNDTVMSYNNTIEVFPNNLVASIFNFKQEELFKINEKDAETPKVEF